MKNKGMTLLELIIAVAIIGVLASLASPNYSRYVLENHRKAVQIDMARIQLQLEQNYLAGYQLSGILSAGECLICAGDASRYQISVSASTHSYTILANPKISSGQHLDRCGESSYQQLTLSHNGLSTPDECWR